MIALNVTQILAEPCSSNSVKTKLCERCSSKDYGFRLVGLLTLLRLHLFDRYKSLPDSFDHLTEPIDIQHTQSSVADQVDCHQPHGQLGDLAADRPAICPATGVPSTHVVVQEQTRELGWRCRQSLVYIRVYHNRLVGSPHDAASEECKQEGNAVVQLELRTSET